MVGCMYRQIDFEHNPKKVSVMDMKQLSFSSIKHGPIFPGLSPASGSNGRTKNMQQLGK